VKRKTARKEKAMNSPVYTVRAMQSKPEGEGLEDPAWEGAGTAEVSHFRPESSDHRPQTVLRLLYNAEGLHGIFWVRDRFVRCVRTNYLDEVWKDSCVELFVEPKPGRGYFNFEFNCGGAFLSSHITDPGRSSGKIKGLTRVPPELGNTIQARGSLPRIVDPEITEPVEWSLRFFVPFAVIEHYIGALGTIRGQVWRGNFYKCAEEVSHPHWAAWSPVDELNFHLPRCFGTLRFA
jgi:hypothetical protein